MAGPKDHELEPSPYTKHIRAQSLYKAYYDRYDFCCCAIGWSSSSTNADNLSVGPETPEIMGLPTGVGLCIFVRV